MWTKGWAEATGGNISFRLTKDDLLHQDDIEPQSDWIALALPLPQLANDRFLTSATGSYLRNVALEPDRNLGVIELNDAGSHYRPIWGFGRTGGPSSELAAHLQAHAVRKPLTQNADRAAIHAHTPNLLALMLACDLDYRRLSRLLWSLQGECILIFPKGIRVVPYALAGTGLLAAANAQALAHTPICLWQLHGAFAMGPTLDAAFGLLDAAEKTALIYLQAAAAGGAKQCLSPQQMLASAQHFNLDIDPTILDLPSQP